MRYASIYCDGRPTRNVIKCWPRGICLRRPPPPRLKVPLVAVEDAEVLAVQALAVVPMLRPVQLRLQGMLARQMALLQPAAEAHEVEEAAVVAVAAVDAAAGAQLPNLPFLKPRRLRWPRLWRNRRR
jgi:hypothetical protein